MTRMTERDILLEQAQLLRSLADTFDAPTVRGDLRRLADRCENLAKRSHAPEQLDGPQPAPSE